MYILSFKKENHFDVDGSRQHLGTLHCSLNDCQLIHIAQL